MKKLDCYLRFTNWATIHGPDSKGRSCVVSWHYLEDRFSAILVACWTYLMRRFAALSIWFQRIGEGSPSKFLQLITLFLSIPCFKTSHFFFKQAYNINSTRLRRLRGEDFFLKFYDRSISLGSVVKVLQSLREIESGLKDAESFGKREGIHDIRS